MKVLGVSVYRIQTPQRYANSKKYNSQAESDDIVHKDGNYPALLYFTSNVSSAGSPKSISFTPSENSADAIKVLKTMGVKNVDKNMPAEVLNWVCEGMVNTYNATGGKVVMFENILYKKEADNVMATYFPPQNGRGTTLNINRAAVENLDKTIESFIKSNIEQGLLVQKNEKYEFFGLFRPTDTKFLEQINDFKKGDKNFSFKEKMELYENLYSAGSTVKSFIEAPEFYLKIILANSNIRRVLDKNSLTPDLSKLKDKSVQQQSKELNNLVLNCKTLGIPLVLPYRKGDVFRHIYHELGHLQHNISAGDKLYEQLRNNDRKQSEITKKFLKDEKQQQIAYFVSVYAPSAPTEFVAETFANMVSQKLHNSNTPIPSDVVNLYKEFKGSEILL